MRFSLIPILFSVPHSNLHFFKKSQKVVPWAPHALVSIFFVDIDNAEGSHYSVNVVRLRVVIKNPES